MKIPGRANPPRLAWVWRGRNWGWGATWPWVKTVLGSHFGIGEFTTHFRTYFSGDWDVHRGHGSSEHAPLPAKEFFSWLNLWSCDAGTVLLPHI